MNKQILYIFNFKIVRVIVFLIVFIFITNNIVSRFTKPSIDHTLAINLETLKQQNFDVLFMSNSYLFTAYDPLLLKSLTGLNSIHLGTSARRLCFEPFILKQALITQRPKLVVIDISSTTIVSPDSDRSWFFNNKAISNFNFSIDKYEMLDGLIPDNRKDLWLQSFSLTTRNLYNLTSEKELKYYGTKKKSRIGKVFGYDVRVKQNTDKLKDFKKDFSSFYKKLPGNKITKYNVIDEESIIKIQELLDIAEEYPEIQFLFINNIKLDASTENQDSIELIKEKAKPYNNTKVLELNTKQIKSEIDLKYEDFYDPGHVRQSGSMKVTSYFSNYLKNQYSFDNFKTIKNNSITFKMKNKKNKGIIEVKDVKLLIANKYNTDVRVLIDSIPDAYLEVSTVISVFPKEGYEHLLEVKSKKNKWKSDNLYRKLKNYIKTKDGYIGKLNSWSKLKPEQIDHIEMKFSGPGVLTETLTLDLNKINILQQAR